MGAYETVDKMVAPTLPVKYPRVPGYRPDQEENKYNAWYVCLLVYVVALGRCNNFLVILRRYSHETSYSTVTLERSCHRHMTGAQHLVTLSA